ncbi:hypothetical protein QN379_17995 [Glaciimonas sp. Gout2]|uniref:hypothetical protein n=1 Tax=unclassified Glaciimonas TaxID=2644401 RepID=UPI002AB3D60E|nr:MULTISPECIES: hypothetical protein [unclassified Glaciimonas]MDY7547287.1 hypothetical protein [Glaciimonas sp. CA11.2]MEB0012553.1 hypothetical protein [Glaciimonas sp. Cout2]MEB0083904.1 hypothetical protein [Glaciimonas sp. Gout2]
MSFIRGDENYLLTLKIIRGAPGFSWQIVITEHRGGQNIQTKELSALSFGSAKAATSDGKNQMFKMLTKHTSH